MVCKRENLGFFPARCGRSRLVRPHRLQSLVIRKAGGTPKARGRHGNQLPFVLAQRAASEGRDGVAWPSSCSQNAHDQNVLVRRAQSRIDQATLQNEMGKWEDARSEEQCDHPAERVTGRDGKESIDWKTRCTIARPGAECSLL